MHSIHIIHMYTYIHTSSCSKKLAVFCMYICMFVLSWCACSSVRFTVVLLACVVSVGEVVRDAPTPLLQHGHQNTKDVERYVSETTATRTYLVSPLHHHTWTRCRGDYKAFASTVLKVDQLLVMCSGGGVGNETMPPSLMRQPLPLHCYYCAIAEDRLSNSSNTKVGASTWDFMPSRIQIGEHGLLYFIQFVLLPFLTYPLSPYENRLIVHDSLQGIHPTTITSFLHSCSYIKHTCFKYVYIHIHMYIHTVSTLFPLCQVTLSASLSSTTTRRRSTWEDWLWRMRWLGRNWPTTRRTCMRLRPRQQKKEGWRRFKRKRERSTTWWVQSPPGGRTSQVTTSASWVMC